MGRISHWRKVIVSLCVLHFYCSLAKFQSNDIRLGIKQYSISNTSQIVFERVFVEESEFVIRNFNETITVLWCEGDDFIEWKYEGEGSPNLIKEELKVKINDTGNGKFLSGLTFRPDGNFLKRLPFHTGKYSCQSTLVNTSQLRSLYLYFPRTDGAFLLNPPHKRFNTIQIQKYRDEDTNYDNLTINFPCILTDPTVNISLYKKHDNGVGKKVFEKVNNVYFDPKSGFRLSTSLTNVTFGEYKCSTNQGGRKDFVLFNVVEQKDIRVFPNETMIFSSTILNLTCESTEPVTIHLVAYAQIDTIYEDEIPALEIIDLDSSEVEEKSIELEHEADDDGIESETEHTELEIHVANHIDLNPSIGDLGEFQCISEIDGRVFHSWIYQIISPEADNQTIGIRYNESSKSFTCQTKTSTHGKLSFVFCDSPSDCKINKICFTKYKNCRGYKKLPGAHCDWENDCREIFHYSGTGYIHCSEDGLDEIVGFADLPNGIRIVNDFDSIPSTDGVVLTHEENTINIGDTLRVYLKKWSYLFLKEHKWILRFQNNSIAYVPKYDNLGSGKFEITPELKSIEAILFYRNSSEYVVSLPIKIKDQRQFLFNFKY